MKYAWQEAEEAYIDGWPNRLETVKPGPRLMKKKKAPSSEGILNLKNGKNDDDEISVFLEETPPKRVEVSRAVLEMIKRAERSIKIIQPYVQNVDELEDLLVEAARDRGVDVEIITARIRDQPVYRTFLNADLFRPMLS